MFMCYLCGKEYGSTSLPIHIPQCQKKWLQQEEMKPKKERRPMPQPPKQLDEAIKGGRALTTSEIDSMNDDSYKTWEDGSLERCPHCDRTFRPEALARHNKTCTASNPFRKAGTGLTAASLSAKLPPGAISGTLRQTVDLGALPSSGSRPSGLRAGPPPSGASSSSPKPWHRSSDEPPSKGATAARPKQSPASPITPPPLKPSARPAGGAVPKGKSVDKLAQSMDSGLSLAGGKAAAFCEECGAKFTRDTAKFCADCGNKRPAVPA